MKNADMPAMPLDSTAENDIGKGYNYENSGLTKREHFAGMAMQGFCSDVAIDWDEDTTAHQAIRHADALLKALEETE